MKTTRLARPLAAAFFSLFLFPHFLTAQTEEPAFLDAKKSHASAIGAFYGPLNGDLENGVFELLEKKALTSTVVSSGAESVLPPDCASAATIVCGQPISSTTVGGVNNFGANDLCVTGPTFAAEDKVYKFVVTERKSYHFILTMAAGLDLDLFLFNNTCSPSGCVSWTIEDNVGQGIFLEMLDVVLNPGTFYLVIDGETAANAGNFTLTADCECTCVEPGAGPNGFKIHCDNFEQYVVGKPVTPQSSRWYKWANNSVDASVQESGGNSFLKISETGGPSDVIYFMGNKTTKKFRMSWRMQIAAGKKGYYAVMYEPPWAGAGAQWGYEVYFDGNGTGTLRVLSLTQQVLYTQPFSYPQGQWFNVVQLIDLDLPDGKPNTEFYVNNEYVLSWEYGSSATTPAKITSINFFAISGAEFLVDDICVYERNPSCVAPTVYAPVCGKNGNEMQNSGAASCQLFSDLEWFDCFNACDVGGTFVYRGDKFSGGFTPTDFGFAPPGIIYNCDFPPTYLTYNISGGTNNAATPYFMDVYVFRRDDTDDVIVNFASKSSPLIRDYLVTCQRPDCVYQFGSGSCLDFDDPTTLPCNELYYILIIGPLGSTYEFSIVPTGPCEVNPATLAVGGNSGTVAGGPSNFSKTSGHYNQCYGGTRTYSGNEETLRFQLDQAQRVKLTLSSTSDMGLFLFSFMCGKDCLGFSETAAGQNGSVIVDLPAGTFYAVVDKNAGASNAFTLTLEKLGAQPPNINVFLINDNAGGGGCPTDPTLKHEVVIEPTAFPFTPFDQIRFLYRGSDGKLQCNYGLFKNWHGLNAPMKFDLFGDLPNDGIKCSFGPNDTLFMSINAVRNGTNPTWKVMPRFKTISPPGVTATSQFQAGKISVIDSLIIVGDLETFSPSATAFNDIPATASKANLVFSSSLPFYARDTSSWLALKIGNSNLTPTTLIGGSSTISLETTANTKEYPRSTVVFLESADQPDLYWMEIKVAQKGVCNPNPTVAVAASVPSATVCAGGSLELSAVVGAGLADVFTYKWSTGATTPKIQASAAGTYTVTITNKYCTATNSASKAVTVAAPPTAQIATPGQLSCQISSVSLNGAASSSGANIAYQWSGPSGPIAGATANTLIATQAGPYALVVTNTAAAGCSASASATVSTDQNVPTATVAQPTTITCAQPTVTLNGSASSSGAYFWTASNGGSLSGSTSASTATATKAGTYTLRVTAPNGCTAEKSVVVDENKTLPTASAGPEKAVTCAAPSVVLDGSGSSSGAAFSFLWTGPSGFSSAFQSPTVSLAGSYSLKVTDGSNGCTTVSTVVVLANNQPPTASAGNDKSLSCTQAMVVLDGLASPSGPSYGFSWAGPGGFSSFLQSPTVSTAGQYSLVVTNAATGCTAIDAAQVTGDVLAPQAVATASGTISCSQSAVTLNSTGSTAGAQLAWINPSGSVFSSAATVSVSTGGLYGLRVTNPANGCTALATVEVNVSTTAPTASAGPQKALTCTTSVVVLDGSGSSSGAAFSFLWTGPGGFSSAFQSPTVSLAGSYSLKVTDSSNGCTAVSTVSVTSNTLAPAAVATVSGSITCAQTSVTISSTGSSSGPGFENKWLAPGGAVIAGNVPTVSVSQTGLFTLVVTNLSNGCTATATAQVSGGANLPTATATVGAPISCQNPFAQLSSAGSTGTPTWAGPGGFSSSLPNPSVNVAGTYTLTVISPQSGCSASASVAVTGNATAPTVSIAVPEKLTCTRLEVFLTAAAASPNGSAFQFSWSGTGLSGSTSGPTATAVAAGLFQVLVTDPTNGCAKTASVTVEKDVAVPTGVDAGGQKVLLCTPPTVQLTGAGPSGFLIQWSGPGNISDPNSLAPTVDAAGPYFLTVTNPQNGCTKSDEVLVIANNAAPVATIQPPANLLCQPPTVTLVGGPTTVGLFDYQWIGPGALSPLNQSTVTVALGGQYTFLVTNKSNGCQDSETVSVAENNTPPTALAGPTKTITCANNKTATLEGSHQPSGLAANYAWTGPGGPFSGPMPTVNQKGDFVLTVTLVQNGCTAISTAIVEIDTTAPTATAGIDQSTCATAATSVFAVGGGNSAAFQFDWQPAALFDSPTAPNPTATITATTTVTVMATNAANQCKKTDQATLNRWPIPAVSVSAMAATAGSSDGSLSAIVGGGTAPFGYQWFLNGQPIANATGPKLENQPSQNGYSILVTDANGCTATASGFSTIVGLEAKSWAARLVVFPNPTDGRVAILLENAPIGPLEWSVADAVGRVLFAEKRQANSPAERWELDFSTQPPGMYWLRLKSRDGAAERKIMVVR